MGGPRRPGPGRRRERLRLRRHQLPHRHGGARARTTELQRPHLDRRAGRRAGDGLPSRARRLAEPRPLRTCPATTARRRCAVRSCSAPPTRLRWPTSCAPRWPRRARAPLDPAPPSAAALRSPERIAIDYADGDELVAKAEIALRALQGGNPAAWPALRARGIFRGGGAPGKVAFLYTGQGSQYANMLADLRGREPIVADVFEEADAIMTPLLEGRRLSDIIFADPADAAAVARAEEGACAARRSPSPRCSRWTWRLRGCWAPTGSARTSSWVTRSASTPRWSWRERCPLRRRSRR